MSLSLFMSVSRSLFIHLALFSRVSLWLCVACCCVWLCVVVCCCVLVLCVCVSSCLALKNASVCTFKTLPCKLSKRPCLTRHGRFEGTRGSVLNVHTEAFCMYSQESLSPSSRLSLSSHVSLFFSVSFHHSLFLFSLENSFSNNDIDRSSGWLSLYTRPWLALRARVRGPWPIPCRANTFASCKKHFWVFLCEPRATLN